MIRIVLIIVFSLWVTLTLAICSKEIMIYFHVPYPYREIIGETVMVIGFVISLFLFPICFKNKNIPTLKNVLMKVVSDSKDIISAKNSMDLQYYGQSEQEINEGTFDKDLWSKALVNANGNEELRKSEYIKLRIKQLQTKIL